VEALVERGERLAHALEDVVDRLDDTELLQALVRVLSRVSNEGIPDLETPLVPPAAADDVVTRADLVRAVVEGNPWLTDASTSGTVQQWITYSGHGSERRSPSPLMPAGFRSAATLTDADLARRPLPGGLFTSSAIPGRPSMWKLFISLDLSDNEDANVWRRPWVVWWLRARVGARVMQVASAVDWVRLVADVPLRRADGLLIADWRVLSARFDAVHVHPQAVAAIDGFRFHCPERGAVTAPVYFSVESTLWLNWVFSAWGRVDTGCGG
jgi:hypothetical protein